jgi:hypothetical protein
MAAAAASGHGLGEPVLDQQAETEGQRGEEPVAQPEERKFLGFSISNDGSERRFAPKALDKFKRRIRDVTRRTRGVSLQQVIKELKPYIVGWRGYFGFCQTPSVLTILEARIRRRLRLYLWRQWRTGQTAPWCGRGGVARRPPIPINPDSVRKPHTLDAGHAVPATGNNKILKRLD